MTNELPEPWATELAPKGIHSYRDMGARVDIAHETARRLMTGGKTSSATVKKVADALFDGDATSAATSATTRWRRGSGPPGG